MYACHFTTRMHVHVHVSWHIVFGLDILKEQFKIESAKKEKIIVIL
jgi:hypothetical protein